MGQYLEMYVFSRLYKCNVKTYWDLNMEGVCSFDVYFEVPTAQYIQQSYTKTACLLHSGNHYCASICGGGGMTDEIKTCLDITAAKWLEDDCVATL